MKKIKIQYIFFALMLLMMSACKKDTVEKSDIPKDDDKDIRVLKVQYIGHDYSEDFVFDPPSPMYTRTCTYHYDKDGRLSNIKNDDILRVQVEYGHEQITVTNEVEQGSRYACYWDNSTINYQNNRIDNIIVNVFSPGFWAMEAFKLRRKMNIRISPDDRLKSVMLDSTDHNGSAGMGEWFAPLSTEILSYNKNGLPDRLDGVVVTLTPIENPLLWNFTFQYNKVDDVPTKLKRLVNEELLFSNRYGVTNLDAPYMDSTRYYSQFGEGNWLISFGLPQYYILEDKSSHIVSKRTTKHYKINDAGEREYIKTTVEDFPYKHDAEARTLEIAGLKIWYEYVEEK
ncbi:MAG: hypothetical protein LC105_11340 [Chitinophagales bacterium]|nr:hypothetical protein [Chitinophagales bacterium]